MPYALFHTSFTQTQGQTDSHKHDGFWSLKFLNSFGFHLETDFITVLIIVPGCYFGFVSSFVCFVLSHGQAVRSSVEMGCAYVPICLGQSQFTTIALT